MRVFILCVLPIFAMGQTSRLSPSSQIRVVTCGPGQEELFTAFGHSAFRVVDEVNNIDYIYNYGVFDFNQPNFYLNFARGFLNYKLARYDYRQFRDYYIYFDRYIHEQILNLNQEEKQKLFEFLEWNNKPENQWYLYDYFYDNCATRIRDALIKVFGDSITFSNDFVNESKTIRELTDDYLQYQPWGDLGIDICLGLPMDKQATPFMYMYLPDYIEAGFDHAKILDRKLVSETEIVYKSKTDSFSITFFTPLKVFATIFLVVAFFSYRDYRRKGLTKIVDILLLGITGFLGLFLLLLWLATDHSAAAYNFNILWVFPMHLVAAIMLIGFTKKKFLKRYFTFAMGLALGMALFWFFLPQKMHYALFYLNLSLLLRTFILRRYLVREEEEV